MQRGHDLSVAADVQLVLVGIFVLEEEVEKVVGIVEAGLPELARLLAYLVRGEKHEVLSIIGRKMEGMRDRYAQRGNA